MSEHQQGASILAAGLCNVESPTLGPDGWILNVCSLDRPTEIWPTRGGDITVTHPDRPLETSVLFSTSTVEISGIPAALAFGPDEAIYVADEGRRAIVRVTAAGGMEDFITEYKGTRINGPNDLVFDPNGNLYFTDPWTSSPRNPVAGVYGYDWAQQTLWRIDTGMQFTNGIAVRDGLLYVAETFPRTVWVYRLGSRRDETTRRLFCRLPDVRNPPMLPPGVRESIGADHVVGPDGLAFDADGNLWVAHYGGSGIFIYDDDDGQLVEVLPVPGTKPTNLCFGGPSLERTYVSIDDPGVIIQYAIGVRGAPLQFCPSRVDHHVWSHVIADAGTPLPGRRPLPRVKPPELGLDGH